MFRGLVILSIFVISIFAQPLTPPEDIIVNNSNSTGPGSLGDALLQVNTGPAGTGRRIRVIGNQDINVGQVVLTNGVNLFGESPLKFKLAASFIFLTGTTG